MEAAGIEPASGSKSKWASTRVSSELNLVLQDSPRPDSRRTSPERFHHPLRAEGDGNPADFGVLPAAPQERPQENVAALSSQSVVAVGNYWIPAFLRDGGHSARNPGLLVPVET